GYYGTLILILIRAAITKQNQFSKTGLEFAFVWYILAEVLSTIFSSEPAASFHNLLKHVLLIPLIYTTIAFVSDYKAAKTFFKIYIGGTLVTVLIYLYFSFQHYLDNLYSVTESGPSIFQFPITASEIISFTVIFLFAFLINEKTTFKNKIFLFIGFSLSLLALFSTYKRTGWMGAAFGILIILIMKKQWKILLAGTGLTIIFFLTQKNISEINTYRIELNALTQNSTIKTEGKAYDVIPLQDKLVVSDYNNGLSVFKNDSNQQGLKFQSAVTGFYHWKDDYYLAGLADTRYILLQKSLENFQIKGEIFSPGYTFAQASGNGFFYILDNDSGLTIFTTPEDLNEKHRQNYFSSFTNVFVDTSFILFAEASKGFSIYSLHEGLPENNLIAKDSTAISFIYYSSPFIFTVKDNGLNIYKIDNSGIKFIQNIASIKNIFLMNDNNGQYVAATTTSDVIILQQDSDNQFKVTAKFNLNYTPKSISIQNNNLFVTHVESKQSRLLAIFDPYHPANANRISFWRAGIKMFKDNPIFGVGDIDLGNLYRQYKRPFDKEIQGHLHNNFFHVLATLGLFGLLAVIYLFLKIILIDIKIFKAVKDKPFIASYALGSFAAFCGFLVSGLTELNFWDHEITTLIWFTLGLNIAFFKSIKPNINN
ncbi:MAG: O-antigen ligase family protein, partial [Ignavibacteria bacterium]|nr:O-antigen ligase family protein [Ignavibacteria bacterium]